MKQIKFLTVSPTLNIKLNGQLISVGQWYDINSYFVIGKQNNSHYGEPLGSIKYISRVDGLESNEAIHTVNFPPDKGLSPYSTGVNLTILNEEILDLSQVIPLNGTIDRVKFLTFDNVGSLDYNGSKVNPGDVFMVYKLNKVKYTPSTGTGKPYQTIMFQVGNKERFSSNYSVTVNIEGKVYLDNPVIVQPTVGYRTSSAKISVLNAKVNKRLRFKVEFETQSLQIFNPKNLGSIVIDEKEIYDASGVYEFEATANHNGQFDIHLSVSSENIITDGSIQWEAGQAGYVILPGGGTRPPSWTTELASANRILSGVSKDTVPSTSSVISAIDNLIINENGTINNLRLLTETDGAFFKPNSMPNKVKGVNAGDMEQNRNLYSGWYESNAYTMLTIQQVNEGTLTGLTPDGWYIDSIESGLGAPGGEIDYGADSEGNYVYNIIIAYYEKGKSYTKYTHKIHTKLRNT